MATRFIELKDAAAMLHVSADELNDMRSRSEIYGYRDGATWKFKMEEVERVAAERGIDLSATPTLSPREGGSGIDDDLYEVSDIGGGDPDSILVSEEELGHSDESTASTIIGKESRSKGPSDDVGDSDVSLIPEDGGSDVRLVSGASDVHGGGAGPVGASDTANLEPNWDADELSLDDGLSLGEDDLGLADSPSGLGGSSAVDLDGDDDLVLDSGIGSDVTKNPSGSGIGLASPSDVGIDLGGDEAAGLSPSGIDSLELGEADEVLSFDTDEGADPAAATQLKADDDFLLTPVEDLTGEESDSGSQVIALDTEEFEEDAGGFGAEQPSPFLEEEADLMGADASPLGAAGAAPLTIEQPTVEAPYSVWNVLSLLLAVVALSFTGILMYELVRNMWSWSGTDPYAAPVMEKVIEMIAGKK